MKYDNYTVTRLKSYGTMTRIYPAGSPLQPVCLPNPLQDPNVLS